MTHIRDWLSDGPLRKVASKGVPVAAGKLLGSLTSLLTMALLAHHLGPTRFGAIALIRTVVTVVDYYADFGTWQAVVRYGTEAAANGRRGDVDRIIKAAFSIDVCAAWTGALVAVVIATAVVPHAFDLHGDEAVLCAIYAFTIATHVTGAPDGIFRIFDEYRGQAISATVSGIISTTAVAVAVALDATLAGCVVALTLGEAVGNLVIVGSALWTARLHGHGTWFRAPLRGVRAAFPGLVRFVLATNAQSTVKKTQAELDMLIVGTFLGAAASGLFRVVKQLGTVPGRLFLPFEQVLFTELARCAAKRDYLGFRRLLWRAGLLLGGGAALVWLVGALLAEPLLRLVAGEDFTPAAGPFRWYLLAMALGVATTPVIRSLVALGRPGTVLLFDLVSLALLAVGATLGTAAHGLEGLCMSLVVHKLGQLVWSSGLVLRITRRSAATIVPA